MLGTESIQIGGCLNLPVRSNRNPAASKVCFSMSLFSIRRKLSGEG